MIIAFDFRQQLYGEWVSARGFLVEELDRLYATIGPIVGAITAQSDGTIAVSGALTGNASTATALQTARTINGVSFDGTANITVTAAAGTLTGATLAANVLASSLTSVGTLASLSVSGLSTLTGVATFVAQPILSSLSTSQAVFSDGSKGLVSNAITGTGNVVMSASPTLTGTIAAAAATFSGTVAHTGHVGFNAAAPTNQLVSIGGSYTLPAAFAAFDIPVNVTATSGGNAFLFQTAGAIASAASGTHALLASVQLATGPTDSGATITNYVGLDVVSIPAFARVTTATGIRVAAPTGAGTNYAINVTSGDIFKAGAAYTNPDYVFEKWATGAIVQFAMNDGADRYDGLRPLSTVESSVRQSFVLPRIAEWRASDARNRGLFGGGDAVLASIEEAYLYLFDHEARLRALEGPR